MKRYTFELVIYEGSDEFWEEITANGKWGVDELTEELDSILNAHGFSVNSDFSSETLKLIKCEAIQ